MSGPERLSGMVRALWTFMAVVCALGSLIYVAFDASAAFVMALAGVAFYVMSSWRHDDLDVF